MSYGECRLNNLDELKEYVYETLCEHDGLIRGAFTMSEQILIRSGRACGMHFTVHGPNLRPTLEVRPPHEPPSAGALSAALRGRGWFRLA